MQTLYARNDYMERENERVRANIKSALSTCTTLNIYCAVEHDVWGIWIEIDKAKYLVNPIDLVNSIFEDDNYYILEVFPATDDKYRTIDIRKDDYCYSWRFAGGLSKDARPIYFNYQEYVSKIKSCMETLYASCLAEKPTAYTSHDFDIDTLGIAVKQMNITAVMPSYYCLMTSSIKEEPFIFEIEEDEYNEHYKIGIGNRQYTTWLTHWDNDYDKIRNQFESFVHNREAKIEFSFDMSDTVLTIKHVTVLDDVKESNGGYGFSYKDYALIEIQPNEFVHGTILKGYCDLKQTIKTLYEGLLTLALAHPIKSRDDDEPTQLEAYNMFKSPIIEHYLSDIKRISQKAEIRQVHVKRILKLYPDFDEAIIDTEGGHIDLDGDDGNIDELYDKDGDPFMIPGLKEWQKEIIPVVTEGASGRSVKDFDWKDYHKRGMELAKQLRQRLSSDFDIWYCAPLEDNSRTIQKSILLYDQKSNGNE